MKYWVNCFIVRCPCFPERKYLLRSGLVVVTISRVSWRRTRETKHLGSMKITIILLGQWVNKLSAEAKWYWQCWPTPLVIHMELLQASAQAEEKVLSWVQVRTRNLVNNGLLRLKIKLDDLRNRQGAESRQKGGLLDQETCGSNKAALSTVYSKSD